LSTRSAELREVVETLAAIERPSASEGEARAADWIAERLRAHPAVETVRWPGIGSLISFDVADGETARRVETSTKLIVNATSLGGVTSVMETRARWEPHRVPAGLLRLSVGLEDPEALWADLSQALH